MKGGNLIRQNLWVVEVLVREVETELRHKFKTNVPEHIVEEMRSEGIAALCSSLSHYRAGKGTKPSTFAWRYVKTYIRRIGEREMKHFIQFVSDEEVEEIFKSGRDELDEEKNGVKVKAGEYGEDPLDIIESLEGSVDDIRKGHLRKVKGYKRKGRRKKKTD